MLKTRPREGQFLTPRNTGCSELTYRSTETPYLLPKEDDLQPLKRSVPLYYKKIILMFYIALCVFIYSRKQLLRRWIGEGNMMNSSTVSGQPGKSMKLLKLVSFILVFYPQIITNFFLRWSSPHLPAFGAQPRLCAVSLLQEAVPGVSSRETHPLL